MNMKKMLQTLTKLEGKKQLNESYMDECGDDYNGGSSMMSQGTPPNVNISFNASGKDNIEDLLDIVKNAGVGKSEISSPETQPMQHDIGKFKSIVDGDDDVDNMDMDEFNPDDTVDLDSDMDIDSSDDITLKLHTDESYANEPDEMVKDTDYMTNKLSGGINKQKKSYKKAENGDNPMNVKEDYQSLKETLHKQLMSKYKLYKQK